MRIQGALRKRQFFISMAELNYSIAELLVKLNQRSFCKLPGSRVELYNNPTCTNCSGPFRIPITAAEWLVWRERRGAGVTRPRC
jgi:hypothetical protein